MLAGVAVPPEPESCCPSVSLLVSRAMVLTHGLNHGPGGAMGLTTGLAAPCSAPPQSQTLAALLKMASA